jgi:hypothetical protein
MAADRDVGFDSHMRVTERGIDIAIALLDDHRLGREPVDLDGIVVGRHHRRQFVHLDDDALGGVLGPVGVVGEHHRERLADVAHPATPEQRLPVRHELLDPIVAKIDGGHIGEVLAGPDRDHAGRGQRIGNIDALDASMRQRRAQHAHMKLTCERHVGGEQAAPAHQRRVLDARDGGTDNALLSGLLHRRCATRTRGSARSTLTTSAARLAMSVGAGAPIRK